MPDLTTSSPVPRRRVFISYSWETNVHQQWVVYLADRLARIGFEVDYDRNTTERRLTLFMERGILASDRVVVVCTPAYAQRANSREHGVGYEFDLLTTLRLNGYSEKIIPILRAGDFGLGPTAGLPFSLGGYRAVDFRDDSQFEDKLDELRREIVGLAPLSSLDAEATASSAQGGMLPAAPAAQTLPNVAAGAPNRLSVVVNAVLAAQVTQLTDLASVDAESDLARMRRAWREGRRREVDTWLERFRPDSARISTLAPAVAAAILRFRAGTLLESPGQSDDADRLLEQAHLLDPAADDRRLRALVAWRRGSLDSALAVLGDLAGAASLNLRAGILLEAEQPHAALDVLSRVVETGEAGSSQDDRTDAVRLRAIALFVTGDIDGAVKTVRQAEQAAPTWLSLRLLGAQIRYFGALSPIARPSSLPTWPQPTDRGLLRRDKASETLLDEALSAVEVLSTEELPRDAGRRVDAWRLACLTAHPLRAESATAACRTILARDPAHVYAIAWVAYHGLPVELEAHLAAARDELVGSEVDHRLFLLTGSLLALGRGADAAALLNEVEADVTSDDAPVWKYWRAHAHIALGEYAAAETVAADLPDEPRQIVNSAIIRARAFDTDDTASVAADLRLRWESNRDARALLALGELQARAGAWSDVELYVDELLGSIDTLDAIRLAAYAHYHTRQFSRCLGVLDLALPRFNSAPTINELRRLRAGALAGRGAVGDAIAELNALVASNPTTEDLLSLARLHARVADLHAVGAIARTLLGRADLDAVNALALADLLSHSDLRLAQSLWRVGIARQLPDSAVPRAMNLAFRLNLDDEAGMLMEPMSRLAGQADSGILLLTIEQVVEQFRSIGEKRERSIALLRRGDIPIHLFADMASASLVRLLHSHPAGLEQARRSPRGVTAAIRHGGRGTPQAGLEITRGRLALDLTAILVAEHLDILTAVVSTFGPVLLHHDIMSALLEEREALEPHQPSQIDTSRALLDAEREGALLIVDSVPSWAQRQPTTAAEGAQAQGPPPSTDGYLLELPDDSDGSEGFAPLSASPLRATPSSIFEALLGDGVILDVDAAEPRRKLGRYAQAAPGQLVPPQGTSVFASAPALDVLTSAGLLRAASRHFRLIVLREDQEARRAVLTSAEHGAREVRWLDNLIHRISDGLQAGEYQLLPEAAPDDRTDRWSKRLRLAFDLSQLDTEIADTVWIDDRCINRHQRLGRLRVVDTLQVLFALVQAAAIGGEAYSRLRTRLRAGQFQLLPLTSDEVIHGLEHAAIREGEVQATETLDALRRSVAVSLNGPVVLQVPAAIRSPEDDLGELPYLLELTRAGPELLRALWTSAYAEGADKAALTKAASRADWYADNLYVDMGLLRSSVTTGGGPPNPSASAVGLGALVGYSIEMLDIFGEDTLRNDVARDYLAWVYRRLIAPRWHQDPELQREVIAYLHHMLLSAPEGGDAAPGAVIASRLMAGRLFDALPETLQEALAKRPEFLAWAGRTIRQTISLGSGDYDVRAMLPAIAAALGGASSVVSALNNDAEARIEQADPPHVVAANLEGGTVVYLDDPVLRILSTDTDIRRQVVVELRSVIDVTRAEVESLAKDLSVMEDGAARFQSLIERREGSIPVHYFKIGERWARERRMLLSDFDPPTIDSLIRHLRLESRHEQPFTSTWEAAGAVLSAEEPPEEAFLRLSGLPLPLPGAFAAAVQGLPPDEQRRLISAAMKRPASPLALAHGIHLLNTLGRQHVEYARLARRLARALVSKPVAQAARALELVLDRGAAAFESVTAGGDHRELLAATWYHAHRILDSFLAAHGDLNWLVKYLEGAPTAAAPTWLFGPRPAGWGDVAHPRYFSPERFLISGIEYTAAADESLLQDQKLVEMLISRVHIEGTNPQLPSRSLFREDSRLANSLGTFLPIHPEGPAGHHTSEILGLFVGDSSRRHFAQDALSRLETSPDDLTGWRALSLIYGDMPVGQEVTNCVIQATDRLDVDALLTAEGGDAAVAILAICRYVAMSGDPQAVARARRLLLQVATWTAAHPASRASATPSGTEGAARDHKGDQENDHSQGGGELRRASIAEIEHVLPEGVLLLARATGTPEAAVESLAAQINDLTAISPALASRFRPAVEYLVTRLPLRLAHLLTSTLLMVRAAARE
jgi:tetratricopeptide (TPR) repeat protein